jgi:hypothetical protein
MIGDSLSDTNTLLSVFTTVLFGSFPLVSLFYLSLKSITHIKYVKKRNNNKNIFIVTKFGYF